MGNRQVLGSLLVASAGLVVHLDARAVNACIDAQGRKFYTDKACPPAEPPSPPPPPPRPLECKPGADRLRQASRLESQFLTRFPDPPALDKAEAADLEVVTDRIRIAGKRREDLIEQRKPLDRELEFYKGKPVPAWLKNKIDANDAHLTAVNDILKNREQEVVAIKARFQCQRDTYGKMWDPRTSPGASACHRPACAGPV